MIKTKGKLYKRARLIGGECEGLVYRIGESVVKKVWHNNEFGRYNKKEIMNRILGVEKILNKKVPKRLKKYLAVPKFLGCEVINENVITYHEYIKKEHTPKKMYDIIEKLENIIDREYFIDMQLKNCMLRDPTNTIYSEGKFYLVDVAIGEKFNG